MKTTIAINKMGAIKRTAQNVYPLIKKKASLTEKVNSLFDEIKIIEAQIDGWETAVKAMTGGFTTSDLVVRNTVDAVDETGNLKYDKNGNVVKVIKYEPNPDMVSFDEDNHCYVINPPHVDGPCNSMNETIPDGWAGIQ